ncbi:DUF502 domain-containing protein [Iodidimonas sp. SYSU 1G8]|uniref:DUF502 domain-containing protein n=1 Tax=Iodidimonas sp. SYSU 1G8 TaxID=3133967 RepID=UPI0031FF4289
MRGMLKYNPFKSVGARLQGWFLTGVLTLIPLWITWIIFKFVLEQLSALGMPAARKVAELAGPYAGLLASDAIQTVLAVVLTVSVILLIGWATTQFIGRRLISLFDMIIQRIPLVEKIYGATKKLLAAMQQKPDGVQRVVLVSFPHENMKAVGVVTRTLVDSDTGETIAAVYVPTTPNPTSGYLELVPLDQVISTDWTMDEAMSFIISGGAVSRDTINFRRSRGPKVTLDDALADTGLPGDKP